MLKSCSYLFAPGESTRLHCTRAVCRDPIHNFILAVREVLYSKLFLRITLSNSLAILHSKRKIRNIPRSNALNMARDPDPTSEKDTVAFVHIANYLDTVGIHACAQHLRGHVGSACEREPLELEGLVARLASCGSMADSASPEVSEFNAHSFGG